MPPEPGQQGTGPIRRVAVAACALLLVCGLALVAWVATHQVSAPQAHLVSASQAREDASGHADSPGDSPGHDGAGGPASGPTGHRHASTTPTPAPGTGSPPAGPNPPAGSHSPARPDRPKGLGRSRPTRVVIPAIDVDSTLQKLGTNPDGTIEVPAPPHYNEAGWYTGSPAPGQIGPAVILGHIDGVGTTPSVFFKLGAVHPGDHVKVTRADHKVVTFTVYKVQRYKKNDFPTTVVYGNTEGPQLRLITCGGTVNPDTGHYDDNTVVFARMTSATK
ncbi:MAG TPA: class F sortase [Nocardioidaceae bacterium]|nr:class F sortase [Nocardioidaceae bacterium]